MRRLPTYVQRGAPRGQVSRGPEYLYRPRGVYPHTGDAFTTRTGLTLSSLYRFDEDSGNLVDHVGSATLTASGTPVYSYSLYGRRAIHYDTVATDRHGADSVNLPTADSLLAGGVVEMPITGAVSGFTGCVTISADPGWCLYIQPTGTVTMLVRDSGASSLVVTSGTTTSALFPGPWLWTIQVDRTNGAARSRISGRYGHVVTMSGSIAGFGDLFGGTQKYAFGAGNALSGGARVGYGFYATGAQCEGTDVLANLHRSLGWE